MILKEDVPVGTLIATVQAQDIDGSKFSSIYYYIAQNKNSAIDRDLVKVDSTTGEVTLLKELDREIRQR